MDERRDGKCTKHGIYRTCQTPSSKKTIDDREKYEDDLLQLAQLRNAIVHDRIAVDFVIAEPND